MHNALFRVVALMAIATLPAGVCAQSRPSVENLSRQLTLRSSGALPTFMQKLLAQLAVTKETKVPGGKSTDDVIRDFCGGSATNDYLAEFDKRYPGERGKLVQAERRFELQACARSTSAVQRIVITVPLEGDAATGLTRQAFGVAPDDVVALCEGKPPATFTSCKLPAIEALHQYNGGSADWLAQLKPGQQVGVPRVTAFTTFDLKEGVSTEEAVAKVKEAAIQVKEATGVNPVAGIQGSGQFRLLTLLKQEDPMLKDTPCAVQEGDPLPDWPFSNAQLLRMLELSREEAKRRGVVIKPAVVRIADTGAEGLNIYFPVRALSVNLSVGEGQSVNGRGRYGIDAEYKGDVRAFPGDPDRLHGTQVADMALGGHGFRSKYDAVYDMVRITFFKIFKRADSGSFEVHDTTLLQSMSAINGYEHPAVVNFSVGGPDELHTSQFQQQVLLANTMLAPLAVVAAGNNRDDLSIAPTYPAAYGGNSNTGNWMVVVGSSAPKFAPAMYSNYSSEVVDILAPGCRLPFEAPDGSKSILTGTSLAAPQVTFVAALLRALGLGQMSDAKIRIIASSDFRPELEGRSRFASVLNAPRAVAMYHDVVRLQGELQDRTGRWEFDPANKVCTDANIPTAKIISVTPYKKDDTLTLRVLYTTATNQLAKPIDCKPADFTLQFVEDNGNSLDPPPSWSKIDVLVPAQKGLALSPG